MNKNIILSLIVLVSSASYAQTDSHYLKAKALFELMPTKELASSMAEALSQHFPTSGISKDYLQIAMEGMQEDFIRLYVKHFSEAELSDILAFYQSETGKKMLSLTPALSQEAMEIGMKMEHQLREETTKMLLEKKAEQTSVTVQ